MIIPAPAGTPVSPPAASATTPRPAVPSRVLLVAGAVVIALAGMRWNIAALAWVAPVPFLLYLSRQEKHGRWLLLAALMVGLNLQVVKIVTAPLPLVMAFAYGVPIALGTWLTLLAYDQVRRHAGEIWGLYAFPALVALGEVAAYRLSEVGVWGALANTQVENLALLQLAALTGLSGVSFVIAWAGSLIATLLSAREPRRLIGHAVLFLCVLVLVHGYGSVRLFATQGRSVVVAAVVSDLIPTEAVFARHTGVRDNTEALFARSELAADRGARLVVWNEGATLVEKSDEPAFIARGAEIARRRGIDLVLAYVVPLGLKPLSFENKYVWLDEGGRKLETYFKHHPVPGEGSVAGTNALRTLSRPYAAAAGAICYDYDFPAMALAHAAGGAGLVAVPASDWRGIDPYHGQMARVRAIEGGFSLLRPARGATSGAFDAYGRTRATMPFFEENDRVMLASVPTERVPTLYARIGDLPALAYAFVLAAAGVAAWRRRTVRSKEEAGGLT